MRDDADQINRYYNATAQVDIVPYGGATASIENSCSASFDNKTSSKNYTAVLGLTEPSTYNSANDPVNAFLTLWPIGFNFTKLLSGEMMQDMPGLEFALFSSE
jgi:hypothetical protein